MFKHAFAGLIALPALTAVAAAQTQAPAQTPTCTMPTIVDTVDLLPVAGTDQVTVPVEINGVEKHFLLDIGTDHSEISAMVASELKLPGANQSSDSLAVDPGVQGGSQFRDFNSNTQFNAAMFDVGGSRSAQDYAPRVRVASFTIGDATGHNLQLVIANDKEMGKSEPYDGRMTGDFFAQYDIDFDFGGKKLSFLTATNCTEKEIVHWPASEVTVVPMTISGGKMKVPVTIQGRTINAVIDTGSAHTVMRRDIAESLGLKAEAPDMTPDGDVRDGLGQTVYVHSFPQISFSGITASNVPVRIQTNSMVHPINRTPILGSRAQFAADPASRVPDLAIGMDVLHQLHMYAAFGENKLYVTAAQMAPAATTPAPAPAPATANTPG